MFHFGKLEGSNRTASFRIFTGARDKEGISDEVKDDLCSLCKGSCSTKDGKEPYLGYVGAFVCMAEGKNDRVGFVKQTTFDEMKKKYPTQYGNKDDYKLLCTDGTTKG